MSQGEYIEYRLGAYKNNRQAQEAPRSQEKVLLGVRITECGSIA